MSVTARLVAAAALAAVVVAGSALLISRPSGNVGQTAPTPSQPAAVQPSAARATVGPSPSAINEAAGYTDLPGWIVFEHFGAAPDGSSASFDLNYHAIWLVHADGSGLHELSPGNPSSGKVSPDISPDGTKVVFASSGDLSSVYEVGIDGGKPHELPACVGAKPCAAADPAYSPDGRRIVFVRLDFAAKPPSMAIAILDLATSKVTLLERTRIAMSQGDIAQPGWSPDDSRIVYARELQTQAQEHITDSRLFVANVDGSAVRELPQPQGAWAADPDWSPDGSTIVFSSLPNRETGWGAGAPTPHIYAVDPAGNGVTQLCDTCLQGGVDPTWTSDGKYILFWGFRSWALMKPDGSAAAHINQAKLTWFGDQLGYGYAGFLQPTP